MTVKSLCLLLLISFATLSTRHTLAQTNSSELIPAVKSSFYYQIGGGDDVPLPAFYDTDYVPLNVEGEVGLGFNCGVFNPVASIRNSLNQIKHSALDVKRQMISSATAALTEFPLYELSRADPNLYNLMTRAMAGARQEMAISTKSCEVMQSEIAAGNNPYARWGQIALGTRWQQEIGTAELSGRGDVNQANQHVSQDAGKSGVPWVDSSSFHRTTHSTQPHYAGGQQQAPIHVIYDTVLSGYRVIVSDSSLSKQPLNRSNQLSSELEKIFPTAKSAASWVRHVVGDETITTYNGGKKQSQPGVGLYTDIQTQTQLLLPKLTALVTNATPVTIEHLQAVSPEGMALSPEVISNIRQQPQLVQQIIVNKLSQNIAAMQVINKTRIAIRILQTGARIPVIYSNQAAQHIIKDAMTTLQQDVQAILMFVRARQTLMSNMLVTIVQAGQSEITKNTLMALPKENAALLEQGAIRHRHSH